MEIPTNPIEISAVVTGVAQVFLSYKKNIWNYFFGFISSALSVYLCFMSGIYADMGINVFYVFMSFYGWIYWSATLKLNATFFTLKTTKKELVNYLLLTVILWIGIGLLLFYATDSNVPFLDAFTTSLCISGMLLMAKRKIENWLFFLVADIVSVPLYVYKEMYFYALLFIILCIFAVLGYYSWKKNLEIVK